MKVAIMQPTYLPWAGYFALIGRVDRFVFLDDVQIERQSWQTRNRICLNGHEQMLSVPILKTELKTEIRNVRVNDAVNWRKKHVKTLQQAYEKTDFGKSILNDIEEIINDTFYYYLSEVNVAIIKRIAGRLELSPEIILASSLGCHGIRSHRLVDICRKVGATRYLSPEGSRGYLEEDGFTDMLGDIPMDYHPFIARTYPQYRCCEFIPNLSVVDLIANIGETGARKYLEENTEQ